MAFIDLNLSPDRVVLRRFGFIALGAFSLLAATVYWKRALFGVNLGSSTDYVCIGLLVVAVVSGVMSTTFPAGNQPLYVLLTLLTFPIGLVVSYLVMIALFYGLFTPISLLFRLTGRDALHRNYDRERMSYFEKHEETKNVASYFRQY